MAYDRSPSKNIYLNVAVNTLKKLRGLVPNAVPNLSSELGSCVQRVLSRTGCIWASAAGMVLGSPHSGYCLRYPLPLLPPSVPPSTNGAPQPLHSEWLSAAHYAKGRRGEG